MSNNILRNKREGFTLVEIMIVVAIIALLASLAVPGFLRARKRSQATRILNDLRLIDSAVDQYAIDNNKSAGDTVTVVQWTAYLKPDTLLYNSATNVLGHSYTNQNVDTPPACPSSSFTVLSDVAPAIFWSPYGTNG